MDKESGKIHINPSFIRRDVKSNKIHVNPAFVPPIEGYSKITNINDINLNNPSNIKKSQSTSHNDHNTYCTKTLTGYNKNSYSQKMSSTSPMKNSYNYSKYSYTLPFNYQSMYKKEMSFASQKLTNFPYSNKCYKIDRKLKLYDRVEKYLSNSDKNKNKNNDTASTKYELEKKNAMENYNTKDQINTDFINVIGKERQDVVIKKKITDTAVTKCVDKQTLNNSFKNALAEREVYNSHESNLFTNDKPSPTVINAPISDKSNKYKLVRMNSSGRTFSTIKESPMKDKKVSQFKKLNRKLTIISPHKIDFRYEVLSRRKLVRRLSASKYQSLSENKTDKTIAKPLLKSNTKQWKVLTKNKLIRVNQPDKITPVPASMKKIKISGKHNLSYVLIKDRNSDAKYAFKTMTKLVRKQDLEPKSDALPKKTEMNKSAYKIYNGYSSLCKRNNLWINAKRKLQYHKDLTKKKCAPKSEKFINIEGCMYKSSSTSLKKLEPKSYSFNRKPKTSLSLVSKYSLRRKNSKGGSNFVLKPGMLTEMARCKRMSQLRKRNKQCAFYFKTGKCKRKERGQCPFSHEMGNVAICTRFLMGKCTSLHCLFSHKIDKNRMPVCSHFLKGSCTKEDCLYRHVYVNPDAPVCLEFLQGGCQKGVECKKKHTLICEQFQKSGKCNQGRRCPLSHPRRFIPKRLISYSSKTRRRLSSENLPLKTRRKRSFTKGGALGQQKLPKQNYKKTEVSGRYFDDFQTEDTNEAAVDTDCDGNQDGVFQGIKNDGVSESEKSLKLKRQRLLKKIEKLKQLYSVGTDELCEGVAEKNTRKCPVETKFSSDKDSEMGEGECIRMGSIPLPDVMPSYIPLALPSQ